MDSRSIFLRCKVNRWRDGIKKVISRELIESRPPSLWRYLELLPVETPRTGFNSIWSKSL